MRQERKRLKQHREGLAWYIELGRFLHDRYYLSDYLEAKGGKVSECLGQCQRPYPSIYVPDRLCWTPAD